MQHECNPLTTLQNLLQKTQHRGSSGRPYMHKKLHVKTHKRMKSHPLIVNYKLEFDPCFLLPAEP